jgi:hypothetical protein
MLAFLLRKSSWSTCSDVKVLLWAVTISPAVENTLSADTLVPGMLRYLLASLARKGYIFS